MDGRLFEAAVALERRSGHFGIERQRGHPSDLTILGEEGFPELGVSVRERVEAVFVQDIEGFEASPGIVEPQHAEGEGQKAFLLAEVRPVPAAAIMETQVQLRRLADPLADARPLAGSELNSLLAAGGPIPG